MLRRLAARMALVGWGAGLESKLWRVGRRAKGEGGASVPERRGDEPAATGEEGAVSRAPRELVLEARVGCSAARWEEHLVRLCWEEGRPSLGGWGSGPRPSSK